MYIVIILWFVVMDNIQIYRIRYIMTLLSFKYTEEVF